MADEQAKLILDEHNYGWRIVWWFPEEGDIGGAVGEIKSTRADLKSKDKDCRESAAVYFAALEHKPQQDQYCTFYWESKTKAQTALRACKLALKQLDEKTPWPAWAKTAYAAGWKPPRGWKP